MSMSSQQLGGDSSSQNKDKSRKNWKLPETRTWIFFLLVLLVNYFISKTFFPCPAEPVKVPYPLFKEEEIKNNVKDIYTKGEKISGQFITPVNYDTSDSIAGSENNIKKVENFTTI